MINHIINNIIPAKKYSKALLKLGFFINLGENGNLDGMRFAPFGEVTKGMEVVDQINAEYGQQPSQEEIGKQGNTYLEVNFPNLDYIKTLTIDE